MSVLIVVTEADENPVFGSWKMKGIFIIFYLLLLLLMWFTIADLKRVELEGNHLYVTNYMKTYKYTMESIAEIKSYELGIFEVVSLHMKAKTKMGKKIRFLSENKDVKKLITHLLENTNL
jgi:hypothetical protein